MTWFLCSFSTNWTCILWGCWLNGSFTFVANFLRAISTNWTCVLWGCWLNGSFTFVANFLCTISTNRSCVLWDWWLDKRFAFMTWFLCTIGTNRSCVLWDWWLNMNFTFVTCFLSSFFPTYFLIYFIPACCVSIFSWWLKSFQSFLQRLFKLRLRWVTQITDILITINGNNTLS